MDDRLIKILPVCEGLQLWLFESKDEDGGAYLSLRHSQMDGEVIFAPVLVPEIVKALIEGARELETRGFYVAGVKDGQESLVEEIKKRL